MLTLGFGPPYGVHRMVIDLLLLIYCLRQLPGTFEPSSLRNILDLNNFQCEERAVPTNKRPVFP